MSIYDVFSIIIIVMILHMPVYRTVCKLVVPPTFLIWKENSVELVPKLGYPSNNFLVVNADNFVNFLGLLSTILVSSIFPIFPLIVRYFRYYRHFPYFR